MSIQSFSKFYYGHLIDITNQNIAFDEGSGEINAIINPGSYTLDEFATAVQTAMNNVTATAVITVTVDRAERKITISSNLVLDLLVSSGATSESSAYPLIGFTGADRIGNASIQGDSVSGSEYKPQFMLQSYVPSAINVKSVESSVNKSTSGDLEVLNFGEEKFIEFDLKYITDNPRVADGKLIKANTNGVADAVAFFSDITKKRRFEFMADADNPDVFEKVVLESTGANSKGVGFKLEEQYKRNLIDIYEVNRNRLRVL